MKEGNSEEETGEGGSIKDTKERLEVEETGEGVAERVVVVVGESEGLLSGVKPNDREKRIRQPASGFEKIQVPVLQQNFMIDEN